MSDSRDVSSLPIAASFIDKLHAHGFRRIVDLQHIKPLDLAQELQITPSQAMTILKQIKSVAVADNADNTANCNSISAISTLSATSVAPTTTLNSNTNSNVSISAKELVARMSIQRPIITFCKSLDTMLGGGIPLGHVTEICGVPGIGKTQLLMQLSLNVQIPEIFHGQGGEAIFLDTEGSFFGERVADMAQELSKHLTKLANHHANNYYKQQQQRAQVPGQEDANESLIRLQLEMAQSMTPETFLNGIYFQRCHDMSEVLSWIQHLPKFLSLHPKVKLIIIDSIAFPFRAAFSSHFNSLTVSNTTATGTAGFSSSASAAANTTEKQRQLAFLAQRLTEVAYQHRCAIVVSNHVTTKITNTQTTTTAGGDDETVTTNSGTSSQSNIVPALGESWAHAIGTRLLLHWDAGKSNTRMASLLKSPSMPLQSIPYVINKKGIRDVPIQQPNLLNNNKQANNNTTVHTTAAHAIDEVGREVVAQMEQIIGTKRSFTSV